MASPILIIGGGLAGLFCALKLAPLPVTILSTAPLGTGASSVWAQGGIAAALADGDTPEKHAADTLIAGAGICDEQQVLAMAREARARIEDLLRYGVPFDRDLEGRLLQSREAAHSENRIVRVKGDVAGKAIMQALHAAVEICPSITVLSGRTAIELMLEKGRASGVKVVTRDVFAETHHASAIVLATGGVGHLYAVTTNPAESCGLGLALAAKAGAVIADAEFVQFHPTAINVGKDPAPLATEALRGEGAILVNSFGTRFMQALHQDAELAPRDVVARGVFAEVSAGRGAFLDARAAVGVGFEAKFPTVHAHCKAAGIDPVKDLIPVTPAEHYHMGGVATDAQGRTSIPGLWAVGEVAATGVHGANRLASNSLLEAVVYAARIAEDVKGHELPAIRHAMTEKTLLREADDPQIEVQLRHLMQQNVGVVRNATGLSEATRLLLALQEQSSSPLLKNMATAALIITVAASLRHESRGGHFRSDFPSANPALAKRSFFTLDQLMKAGTSC